MTWSAGSLNRCIRIERPVAGTDAAGQPLEGWELFKKVWADVRGATGMASIRQSSPMDGVAVSIDSYSFRIWFRTDINPGMRIVYRGQVFDIQQVRLDLSKRVWTDLVCEAGGNHG